MKNNHRLAKKTGMANHCLAYMILFFIQGVFFAAEKQSGSYPDNENLLLKYIETNKDPKIVFDTKNIKQYWIEHNVLGRKESFDIILSRNGNMLESGKLNIKLVNVDETMQCRIDVISDTDTNDFSFSIYDEKSKVVCTSNAKEKFIDYYVSTASFDLDKIIDSFSFVFASKIQSSLSIRKIILSFSNNPKSEYLRSPGRIEIKAKDLVPWRNTVIEDHETYFSSSGKSFGFLLNKKILISSKPVSFSSTIKNTGENATFVYMGFAPYARNDIQITSQTFPYNTNKILTIIEDTDPKSQTILVDSSAEWKQGCHLALNAKEDLSDFPNSNFARGTITKFEKEGDGRFKITFNAAIGVSCKKRTKARIQTPDGGTYIYLNQKLLKPGEEVTFSSELSKDENVFAYSSKAFCRGTHYFIPVILSISNDSKKDNAIQVRDFTISY